MDSRVTPVRRRKLVSAKDLSDDVFVDLDFLQDDSGFLSVLREESLVKPSTTSSSNSDVDYLNMAFSESFEDPLPFVTRQEKHISDVPKVLNKLDKDYNKNDEALVPSVEVDACYQYLLPIPRLSDNDLLSGNDKLSDIQNCLAAQERLWKNTHFFPPLEDASLSCHKDKIQPSQMQEEITSDGKVKYMASPSPEARPLKSPCAAFPSNSSSEPEDDETNILSNEPSNNGFQNLKAIQELMFMHLKQFHPLLQMGSPNSARGNVNFGHISNCPRLSTIPEEDSLSKSMNRSDQANSIKNEEKQSDRTSPSTMHLNNKNSIGNKDGGIINSNSCNMYKPVKIENTCQVAKTSKKFDLWKKCPVLCEEKSVKSPKVLKPVYSCLKSPAVRSGDAMGWKRAGISNLYDMEPGILEEPDLTLIGPELTLSTSNSIHLQSVLQLRESSLRPAPELSKSLMSFLRHEESCMASEGDTTLFK